MILDRIDRAAGKPPMMIPVVDPNRLNRSAMTTKDSNASMGGLEGVVPHFKNQVTLRRFVTQKPTWQCQRRLIQLTRGQHGES